MTLSRIIIPVLLALLSSLFGCTVNDTSVFQKSTSKPTSGWLISEFGDKKSPDTFYFKVNVSVNSSIKNGAKKEFSCKQAALEEGKSSALYKVSDDLAQNLNTHPFLNSESSFSVKEVRAKECKPTSKMDSSAPFSEWSQCECIVTAKVDFNTKSNLLTKSFN